MPAPSSECYLIAVRRLLVLLVMFALSVSNGAGLAAALCQHEDVRAHAAALESADRSLAAAAASEDTAAASKKSGALADSAGTSLAGLFLPPDVVAIPAPFAEATNIATAQVARLSSRTLSPLLQPPLA